MHNLNYNVIARTNDAYGIQDRVFVTNVSKARLLDADMLAKFADPCAAMSLRLQAAFGLRREESIKIIPAWADRGDVLRLKAAKALANYGSLIPAHMTYRDQLNRFRAQCDKAGIHGVHGLRHQYAQTRWVADEDAKGNEDIHISLSDMAVEILTRQVGKHPERVFTYAGRPVQYVNTKAWRQALKRAGIDNFRWHDLRHTWASWLVQNGTPLYDLREMGGWKSVEMVRRYAHLAPAQMAKHAAIVGEILRGTNPS